jgi:hypothetical protein
MTTAARSVQLFGIYLLFTGAFILVDPMDFLGLVRLPPPTDPWLRVLGVPMMAHGLAFIASARSELTGYLRISVWIRFFSFSCLTALVVLRLVPPVVILFAFMDAAGAVWTWRLLPRGTSQRAAA